MAAPTFRVRCTGRGDNGDHCCYINGGVCEFLFINRVGIPRCRIWDTMDSDEWRGAPVGHWMADKYPGFDCQDWPQNIPGLLERVNSGKIDTINPSAVCCWGVTDGDT